MQDKSRREKAEYTIKSVTNALDLLEQFAIDRDELDVSTLVERLNLPRSIVLRLLRTLKSHGFVDRNRLMNTYRLGIKTLALGQTYIRYAGLPGKAQPILENLVKQCNETCYLTSLRQNSVVCIHKVETSHAVRIALHAGARLPAYCSAAGKAYLAYLPEECRIQVLPAEELKAYTSRTITGRERLSAHLNDIARLGYALETEELDAGVRSVAAPVWDHNGRITGTLCISGPSPRFSDERLEQELIPLTLRTASEISTVLGYRPMPSDTVLSADFHRHTATPVRRSFTSRTGRRNAELPDDDRDVCSVSGQLTRVRIELEALRAGDGHPEEYCRDMRRSDNNQKRVH